MSFGYLNEVRFNAILHFPPKVNATHEESAIVKLETCFPTLTLFLRCFQTIFFVGWVVLRMYFFFMNYVGFTTIFTFFPKADQPTKEKFRNKIKKVQSFRNSNKKVRVGKCISNLTFAYFCGLGCPSDIPGDIPGMNYVGFYQQRLG